MNEIQWDTQMQEYEWDCPRCNMYCGAATVELVRNEIAEHWLDAGHTGPPPPSLAPAILADSEVVAEGGETVVLHSETLAEAQRQWREEKCRE